MCQASQTQDGSRTAQTTQNVVIHSGNQKLQLGPDQLSHNTMKIRTDLIQIKHHFPIFSFRYLKKLIFCSSTTEAKQVEQRNWMHKNPFSQTGHHDTPQVKWLKQGPKDINSSVLLNIQAGTCRIPAWVLGYDFSHSPNSMPSARINGGCGVSNRVLSPLQEITRNWRSGWTMWAARWHHPACKERLKL